MTAIEELRSMAESVGLAMPQAATLMMEAADTIDRLDAENAKLRELCGDLHECARESGDYCPNTCKHWDEKGYCCTFNLADRMRELGIEVEA